LAFLFWGGSAALAQSPVEWSVQLQGDVLNIDAKTTATQPAQRLNSSPAFLEIAFPKAKLAGAALSKAVDKGLVQKVQTLQDGESAVVRIFVLSKPKANLAKTATGYRYSIRMSEPAGSPSAAKAPVAKPATAKAPKPPAVATQPRVIEPPVAATPPSATPPPASGNKGPKTPVTVVFKDKPLTEAIKELADKAGYTAQLDPKLSGVVNLSISDVPFEDALMMLLEPYGDTVTADIGYTSITVAKASATATQPPAAPAGPLVSEYYPFSTKDAQKMMDAAMKAIPELSYRVDPVLNILLVQGPREDVVRLGELLKSMSNK
jgi:hypothetical protein